MPDTTPERRPRPQDDEQQPAGPDRTSAGQPPARWRDVAEEAIEEAIRAGAFDDLPGRGKPLNIINNPYAPGTELAYQLLKDNQFTLPWISERASLLAQIEDLREQIGLSWAYYRGDYRAAVDDSRRLVLAQEWSGLLGSWEETIAGLNQAIGTVNLKQPGAQLEILKLALNSELERAGASRMLG